MDIGVGVGVSLGVGTGHRWYGVWLVETRRGVCGIKLG